MSGPGVLCRESGLGGTKHFGIKRPFDGLGPVSEAYKRSAVNELKQDASSSDHFESSQLNAQSCKLETPPQLQLLAHELMQRCMLQSMFLDSPSLLLPIDACHWLPVVQQSNLQRWIYLAILSVSRRLHTLYRIRTVLQKYMFLKFVSLLQSI